MGKKWATKQDQVNDMENAKRDVIYAASLEMLPVCHLQYLQKLGISPPFVAEFE